MKKLGNVLSMRRPCIRILYTPSLPTSEPSHTSHHECWNAGCIIL